MPSRNHKLQIIANFSTCPTQELPFPLCELRLLSLDLPVDADSCRSGAWLDGMFDCVVDTGPGGFVVRDELEEGP